MNRCSGKISRASSISISSETVTSGRPSLVFFATPAFCQTGFCGPTVELVKSVAREHEDHVRTGLADGLDVGRDRIGRAAVPLAGPAARDVRLEHADPAEVAVEVPWAAGADVVVNFVHGQDAANGVVDEIEKTGSRAYAHQADVSDEDQVQAMFQKMFSEFGTIDILINNAGITRDNLMLYQQPVNTLYLQPDAADGKDTYLYEWKSTWNYGISDEIWADDQFADSTANGLLRFDLSALPAEASIQSANNEGTFVEGRLQLKRPSG